MSQSVKMLAVLDGETVVVGRCHPGQARRLMKSGRAEWKDGSVLLKDGGQEAEKPPEVPRWRDLLQNLITDASLLGLQGHVTEVARSDRDHLDPAWIPHTSSRPRRFRPPEEGDLEDIFREAQVDGDLSWVPMLRGPKNVAQMRCDSILDFMVEFASRRAQEHEIHSCDDPKTRTFGFVDVTDSIVVSIPVTVYKQEANLLSEDVREAFATNEGRARMFESGTEEFSITLMSAFLRLPESRMPDVPNENEADGLMLGLALEDLWPTAPALEETIPTVGREAMTSLTLADYSGLGQLGPVPTGWARFRWPGCESALPVFHADRTTPHPSPMPDVRRHGFFRRHGVHLYRVWSDGWDRSVLDGDIYLLEAEQKSDEAVPEIVRRLELETSVDPTV